MADQSNYPKARKRAYIAMLETESPTDERENEVVIGNRVSQTAIRRSGLLSGIESTHGHASLPGHLSPEDVRLWETACTVNFDIPLDELVTVLKVADALGDEHSVTWVETLAKRASATDWQDHLKGNQMLSALLRIPSHLLPSVLSKSCSLDAILSTFPPSLHLPAVSAVASTHYDPGTVAIRQCNADSAFHALACTLAPMTPISGVIIHSDNLPAASSKCSTATGVLLARAASVHPSLTRLTIESPVHPQWLRNFTESLAPGALPRLVELALNVDAFPGGGAEVLNCLLRLPALTSLAVGFQLLQEPASSEVSLTSYTRLAAPSASLPHLKHFRFIERGVTAATVVPRPSCASSFLPFMRAPAMTRIHFRTVDTHMPLQDFLEAVAQCPGLQVLGVEAKLRGKKFSHTPIHHSYTSVSPRPSLPPLTSINVRSTCPASVVALAMCVFCRTEQSLTSLQMNLDSNEAEDDDGVASDIEGTPSLLTVWSKFCEEPRRLRSLRSLELNCICGIPSNGADQVFSHDLARGLSRLTNLTCLQLQATARDAGVEETVLLTGASIGRAVAALCELRTLSFVRSLDAEIEFDSVLPVLSACAQLDRLTQLSLCCYEVPFAEVLTLLEGHHALKELQLNEATMESWGDGMNNLWEMFPNIDISND